jgi:hypothetical protein
VVGGCGRSPGIDIHTWTLSQGRRSEPVTLPAHVDDRLAAEPSIYYLRTSVAVPVAWRGRELTLSMTALPAVAELYAAGQLVHQLASWPGTGYRDGPHVWRIPPALTDVTELALELRVRYRWSVAAWLDSVPRLGPSRRGDRHTRLVDAFNHWTNLIAVATLTTIAFTYLVLFLYDRKNVGYAWLALQVSCPSYYLLFHLGVTQVVPVRLDAPLMGISLSAAVVVGVRAAHVRFGLGPMGTIWWWLLAANVVAMAWGARRFVSIMPYAVMVVATLASGITYVTFRLLREAAARRDGNMALDGACWACLAVFTPPDGWFWIGAGELFGGLRVGALGLISFPLLQFVMLCRALQRQRLEIADLNRELRHQIAERSQQLEAALAKLRTSEPPRQGLGIRPAAAGPEQETP